MRTSTKLGLSAAAAVGGAILWNAVPGSGENGGEIGTDPPGNILAGRPPITPAPSPPPPPLPPAGTYPDDHIPNFQNILHYAISHPTVSLSILAAVLTVGTFAYWRWNRSPVATATAG